MKTEKKHLSFTQISMYLKCPRQYELRYLRKIRTPPTSAMVQSRAWHAAVERNYRQKILSGRDLRLSDMEECFVNRLDEALAGGEVVFKNGEDRDSLIERGLAITAAHHKNIAPRVRPRLVEEKFIISLGEDFPYELTGVWDVVEENGTIADNKAYGKPPTQAEVDKNLQFTVYSLAYRVLYGLAERGLRMDAVIKDDSPRAVQLATRRSNADCMRLLKLIEDMVRAVIAGDLLANPSGWWCSPGTCAYWGSYCVEGYGKPKPRPDFLGEIIYRRRCFPDGRYR